MRDEIAAARGERCGGDAMREGGDQHHHAHNGEEPHGVGRVRLDDQQRQQQRAEAARAKLADEETRLPAQRRAPQDQPLRQRTDDDDRGEGEAQRAQIEAYAKPRGWVCVGWDEEPAISGAAEEIALRPALAKHLTDGRVIQLSAWTA
jgi:hypothetical protein